MSDYHREFVLESREHLTTLEESLLALEKALSQQEIVGHIDRGLRAIHSFKGDAGFFGFQTLRSLAHGMESLLESFRSGSAAPPAHVVETLLSARDHLAALVEDLEHSHEADIASLLAQISSATQATADSSAPIVDVDVDLTSRSAHTSGRLCEFFKSLAALGNFHAQQVIATGALTSGLPVRPVRLVARLAPCVPRAMIVQVLGDSNVGRASNLPNSTTNGLPIPAGSSQTGGLSDATDENVYPLCIDLAAWSQSATTPLGTLLNNLAQAGRLIAPHLQHETAKLSDGNPVGPLLLQGEFHSKCSISELQRRLELPAVALGVVPDRAAAQRERLVSGNREIGPESGRPEDTEVRADARRVHPVTQVAAAATVEPEQISSLRVNVELLDRLMTLVGELTLVRNQSLLAFVQEEGTARAIIQRLNSVTSDLQDTVLRTRMQPVGNLFGKFPRMVRDLAKHLGKQVEVITVGREVELDKTVLEQLSDPLTHLIRNSIDHGIEPPDVRIAHGKSSTGQITLSATPADGQVQIEIRDDGRGIDPAAIKAKALALRLKSEAELERMSNSDLFSLILLPGFSTAKGVTEVSGRGVGMDVVKTNVDQLEGTLTIDSTPGVGTSMLVRVPLTLAIIPCLVVDVGNERYAVPQRELEEVVCLHPGGKGAIEHTFDSEVFRLRKQLLPIVRFREVLARTQRFTAQTKAELLRQYNPADRDPGLTEYIVVLRCRGKRFGLLVDHVRGTQEVVVKPMHPTLKRLGVFAGATLMGDGRVALIANVDGIMQHADCRGSEARTVAEGVDAREPTEVHRILVFECGPREQFALPLVQIRRIESITTSRIEYMGDHEFVTFDGIATRIVRLDKILDVTPCPQQSTMYLVLPKFVPEPMGILISRIIDTDSLAVDLQRATIADAGVLGTAIVRGRLSLFLDIQYIREQVFGQATVSRSEALPAAPAGQQRVLLIDDTPFFRHVVQRYLEAAGISVATAADGHEGLNRLASGQFDLIVCDIQMPNLDGWGFAQAARERGCQLPMLALTSLSKVEHEARARSCGFDEFQEKLDHDQLLLAVRRLLTKANQANKTDALAV